MDSCTEWIISFDIMYPKFLPVVNLLNQFLKQISRPVSVRMVKYAKTHPVFRRNFLILPGRWFHTLDERVRGQVISGTTEDKISKKDPQVDDETSIEAGANLMSELIIFLIAGLGVMAEVSRNARNSAAKEAVKEEQKLTLINKKDAISARVEKQGAMIITLEETVNECIRLAPTPPSPQDAEK